MSKPLRSGAYLLPTAVPNPGVDRRTSRDWRRAPRFEPGRYLVTVSAATDADPELVHVSNGRWSLVIGPANRDAHSPFLSTLVRDQSLDGHLHYSAHEHGTDPHDVLLRLVDSGAVSDDAVRVAMHATREANEAAWAAEEASDA